METTNYQQQVPFDLETKGKIQESLQEIYNKQQQQQQATNANSGKRGKFIKFIYDLEQKRLSFTGRFNKEQVPYKDFITNEVIQGSSQNDTFLNAMTLQIQTIHLKPLHGNAVLKTQKPYCTGFQTTKMC
jgi:hypothetical protein